MNRVRLEDASFRDPSGFIFYDNDNVYRQINRSYQTHFDELVNSGLYAELVDRQLLISHEETDIPSITDDGYRVIKPRKLNFISYPYEWSFGQLKAAALTTLRIQKLSLSHGLTLKDASAYNIQFIDFNPVLIDTLSFERLDEVKPWIAYRQFCQHFLAPLALMVYSDIRLASLLKVYIDGIPLDLASRLLPWKTRFSFPLLTHIHLHARSQSKHAGKDISKVKGRMSRNSLLGLVDNLMSCCNSLKWKSPDTVWGNYYSSTSYTASASDHKAEIVKQFARRIEPQTAWDLGANNGQYSRILSGMGVATIAFDMDPVAVESNWLHVQDRKETYIHPLLLDLTNPSSGIGWAGTERQSLVDRGPVDLVMALALVHHLAIGNNVPFRMIAEFFARVGQHLIIEFVPPEDSQVQRILSSRVDVFAEYDEQSFRKEFLKFYEILECVPVKDSPRLMFLMKRVEN